MGWEQDLFALFDDLERQAETLYAAERESELSDRSRSEYSSVTLASRLMASLDREVTVHAAGVGAIAGALRRVADGWFLVRAGSHDWIVRTASVTAIGGAATRSVPEVAWSPVTRLGLGSALRRLADARSSVIVHLTDGSRHAGVLHRSGRDFVEVAIGQHEAPRSDALTEHVVLVSHSAVAAIQSRE